MYNNKFAADYLASNFKNSLSKLKGIKKEARAKDVSPEDFLIETEPEVNSHSNILDNKIEEVSSYVKDDKVVKQQADKKVAKNKASCNSCNSQECSCQKKKSEDISYLVDKKAQYVLFQLGKIASGLREKNNNFAADMVEATALEIKDQTLQKAAKKYQVVTGLQKMAKAAYKSGDSLTGDVITVSIEEIKKSH